AEGERIARYRPGAAVFVEVNMAEVPGRPGVAARDTPGLVEGLRALGLDVRGLMTVGPPGGPEAAREPFRRLAALARDLGVAELSMGMTDDVEVAVEEGSTMVRVGRALFGPRPSPGP
ncbi:MAG TPA: alanine racemase, partial [Acidimicrobiales bacterium]|nr:alanine racemase [Acidimicrobiales bacterium]